MFQASILGIALLVATVFIHYEGLRFLWTYAKAMHGRERLRPMLLVFGIIVLHLIETVLYGAAYWLGEVGLHIGEIISSDVGFRDYIYFSGETYTTLGFGDMYPTGDLRLIASVEALCGLLMIGWSASFLYLAMERYWDGARRDR